MITCLPRLSASRALRRARGTRTCSGTSGGKREDQLVVALMNLKNDGGREPSRGVLPERWLRAYEDVLAPLEPDVVATTEFTYSQTKPDATWAEKRAADRRFWAAQEVLKMRGFRAKPGQGRNPTGMFVREGSFILDPQPQRHYDRVYRTPPTHVVMRLPEVPHVPINVLSHHAPYCNPPLQLLEAFELTSAVDKIKAHYGEAPDRAHSAAWILGDWNQDPWGQTPGIAWNSSEVTDVVHRCHRAIKLSSGPGSSWVSRTAVDELFMDCGMHDPARFAALHLNQPDALLPTAGHADSGAGQGGLSRIDRAYWDAWTVQAVEEVRVVDMAGISDHHVLIIVMSRPKLAMALRRDFAPLADWALAV
jgi:hypothetical protein